MSSNFRTDKKNMDWRIIHELWMRFCYQTQKPTTTEIGNIIEDLQPLLCELETELDSQAVKTWFGNTRQRPYPSLSIQDIDSAQIAHAHLIAHVPIVGAAKKHLNAWQQKKKVPAMTADQKAAKEQQKLEKKSSVGPKPVTAARQPHIQQPQPYQIYPTPPQMVFQPAAPMYYQPPLPAYQQYPVVQPAMLWYPTGQQLPVAQPMQPVRQLKMGHSRVHVDREIRHHPYAGHYMSAPQMTHAPMPAVHRPAVPQAAVQQWGAQQSAVQQPTVQSEMAALGSDSSVLAVPPQSSTQMAVNPAEISLFSSSSQPRPNAQAAGPSSMPPATASPSNVSSSPIRVDDDEDAEFLRMIGFHTEEAGSSTDDEEDGKHSEVDDLIDKILAERKRAQFPEDDLDLFGNFDNFEFQF